MVGSDRFRNLSNADLQRVMLVCEQVHLAKPSISFIHHCHNTLNQLFSNVHFSAEIYRLDPFHLQEQEINTLNHDRWIPLFKEHIMDHPYVNRIFNQTKPEVSMTHLEPTLKQFHRSALYNEFYNKVQAQNQLWLGLRDGNELLNCVYSREKEYSENHRTMMSLIQPHLEIAWKNWKRTHSFTQELNLLKAPFLQSEEEEAEAARLRKAIDALPPRQREVVEWVANGKDNQQVADEMQISILTVKKHLQAVFQSMGVIHRTELAARWHQAHSVTIY